jgi:signal transduction histidine kinase
VRPIRLQVEPVSLARLLDEAVQLADGQARRGDVRVHVDLPRTLPAIEADAQQLRQLFTNLVTNAFEALGGRGTVRVSAMHVLTPQEPAPDEPICHGAVTITVADDGPGVPAEVRDRIFSPFFTTKPRGSGLGLSIVRKIVDAHEGRIDLDAADHGTTFRIVLPVKGT